MKRILGIDLGIASIGWALVEEYENREDNKIIKTGVRIFTQAEDPQTGASLALPRRLARGARRVTRRKRKRMYELKQLLMQNLGLKKEALFEAGEKGNKTGAEENLTIYKEKKKIDVWQLRNEALQRKLTSKEFARILTQIAKRRGYKSNAKNKDDEEDGKKIGKAIEANKKQMEEKNCQTVGQFFYQQMLEESKKNDNQKIKEKARIRNKEKDYKHCVTREMLEHEVKEIFKKQGELHFEFGGNKEKFLDDYLKIAFFQNPLKSVAGMIGNCTLEEGKQRAAKQCYSAEIFVALTRLINNAVLVNTKNRREEISLLETYGFETIEKVLQKTKAVKCSTLRKELNILDIYEFKNLNYNPQVEKETKLPSKLEGLKKIIEENLKLEISNEILEKISYPKKKDDPLSKREKHTYLRTYADLRRRLNLKSDFKFPNLKYLEKREDIIKKVEEEEIISLKGYHTIKDEFKDNEKVFKKIFDEKGLFNQIGRILAIEKDTEKTEEELKEILQNFKVENQNSFSAEEIGFITKKLKNVSFDKFLSLSVKAIDKLLPFMKQGMKYNEACIAAGYEHHSNFQRGEKKKKLRPLNREENYQVTNPVVKRAFSQFRKVVNAIIKKYGQFDAMHIEVGKELKNSKRKRDEIKSGQDAFKDQKKSLAEQFEEHFRRAPSGKELLKIRLYEEQGGKCIYSGKQIDYQRLIQEPYYCQVDHTLPYSRSFDNSLHNKVLCLSNENQHKGNQTPFEYLANSNENSPEWHTFMQRVNACVNIKGMKKRNLFNTTLTKRHGNELSEEDTEDTENNFIARNLIDSQYLAKFIKNFVENNLEFKENDKIKQKVKVRTGSLTSYLRHLWGLGKKDRNSHLHHAEDATIIAFATQAEVQKLSTYSAKRKALVSREEFNKLSPEDKKIFKMEFKELSAEEKQKEKEKIGISMQAPFDKKEFLERIKSLGKWDEEERNTIVSQAPRRKVTGKAHKETLWGTKQKVDKKGRITNYPVELNKGNSKPRAYAERGEIKRTDIFRKKDKKDNWEYYIIPIYVSDFIKNRLPDKIIPKWIPINYYNRDGSLNEDCEYEFYASFYENDLIKIIRKNKREIFEYFYSTHVGNGSIKVKKINEGTIRTVGIQNAIKIEKYQVSPLGEVQPVTLPERKRIGTKRELKKLKQQKEREKNG